LAGEGPGLRSSGDYGARGKGFKDRMTMLPEKLLTPLSDHLTMGKTWHVANLADGFGKVYPCECGPVSSIVS
ncbi:MAG: hypothetical protein RKO68_08920, partial [Candidatus Accumulibacter sp.]|nr:hypothetical protein [Accumulibacter sp.]